MRKPAAGPSQRQLRVAEEIRHVLAGVFERRDFRDPGLAEAIYDRLDPAGQEQARRVFLCLVNVSEDHADTRRRARLTELEHAF